LEQSGQLYQLNRQSGVVDTVRLHIPAKNGALLEMEEALLLSYDPIRNALWGCAQQQSQRNYGMLFRYDIATCQTYVFDYPGGVFTGLVVRPDGRIFLAAETSNQNGVLVEFAELAGGFRLLLDQDRENFLRGTSPQCLQLANNGELLIGTKRDGLFIYHIDQRTVKALSLQPGTEEDIIFNDYAINVIHEAEDGMLWVGTRGGLLHFDPKQERLLNHYGRNNGLSSNLIVGILPDSSGGFWLSTFNGISHIQPGPKPLFRRYYRADGLSNDEFEKYAYHLGQDGRYYFGGINGLTVFYPHELASGRLDANVVLTEISLYGRGQPRLLNKDLDELEEVVVRPNEKGIAVSFALPA
ncbi:MAG: hypothetical protein AAFU67_18965, partial [Bacteroidota bacterium]